MRMNPETDGDKCTYCNNYIWHPFQMMIKEQLKCRKGHEIVYVDGCVKCGKPVRKEVSERKKEYCEDWVKSNAYDWSR